MKRWYQRQFGATDHFALRIAFSQDPHPAPGLDPSLVASWGTLELWVRDRCLTRSATADGSSDGITWYLLPMLRWLARSLPSLVNEEPFPAAVSREDLRDACDWLEASEQSLLTLSDKGEEAWFDSRWEWRERHALRTPFSQAGACCPHVMIRRLGDFAEVSWDNDAWSAPRPGLDFTDTRGSLRVSAHRVAQVLRRAVVDASTQLYERVSHEVDASSSGLPELAAAAQRPGSWEALIPPRTAAVLRRHFPALARDLDERTTEAPGPFVQHSAETLLLRHLRTGRKRDVQGTLKLLDHAPEEPWSQALQSLRQPTDPDVRRPWLQGYQAAIDIRESLGWGDEPLLDLSHRTMELGVHPLERSLADGLELVTIADPSRRPLIAYRPRDAPAMPVATGLGHLILDRDAIQVDGSFEHWPTAARARAFGAMLLMPEEGVRSVLRGRKQLDAEAVHRLMKHFGTTATATTWHVENLGLISGRRREDLLRELAS